MWKETEVEEEKKNSATTKDVSSIKDVSKVKAFVNVGKMIANKETNRVDC